MLNDAFMLNIIHVTDGSEGGYLANSAESSFVGEFVFPGKVEAALLSRDEGLGSGVRGPGVHYPRNSLPTTAATEGQKDTRETIIYVRINSLSHELAVIQL